MPSTGEFEWHSAKASFCHGYVAPVVIEWLGRVGAKTVLDLGCGNGALTQVLHSRGYDARGMDISRSGLAHARAAYPEIKFVELGVQDDPARLGCAFDAVVSTEVIEHLAKPGELVRFARAALNPGGHLIISTPYHGWFKNLLLSLTNGWDNHFGVHRDYGHVKFFSRQTLEQLLLREGFRPVGFEGAGRIPYAWKSMISVSRLAP